MPRRQCAPPGVRAALALAAMIVLAGGAPSGAATPALVFESETCDVGSIVQGERPECVFSFSNAGAGELRILEVLPSCGCTTALPGTAGLGPGERGTIRVVFDSESFAGEVVKEVEVRSNDPARPLLTLHLRSLVEPEIEFEPPAVTFDAVRAGAPARQIVTLTNRRAEPVRVLTLAAEPSSYRCVAPAWSDPTRPLQLEPWDRAVLEVQFTPPPVLAMPIAGECTLEIEGPRKRHFRLKLLSLPGPQ
ncbi:MAG TPA: DUF1573 domain-containing protein [Candidatus Methanoperedens sp.]|nr:DUF1573 domain-containing protein [Candidatus Methanoperedens sp.]